MNSYDLERIDNFFSTIQPWEDAYTNVGFSFFAVRKNSETFLLQARLFLNAAPSAIPKIHIETQSMMAGHFPLSELGLGIRQIVDVIVSDGALITPYGKLIFPKSSHGDYSAYFDPFHQEGIASGNRLPVLTISGESKHLFMDLWKFDWELKAQPQPYDSVDELLIQLVLGGKRSDSATIEIVAYTVAFIDQSSSVKGDNAAPCIMLAKSLNRNKCQIGYRVFLHGKVIGRGAIKGHDLEWNEQDGFLRGKGWVGIQEGAVLHCVASYNGYAQHQWWVVDPAHSQNARRVSLEASDEKLTILRDYLFEEQNPRKNSRDFEFGVAWLMWMLGFNVTQAGGTDRSSDAADILATSPQGNIMVVECTTGILKAQNKLANLVDRTEAVRKRIAASGNSHLKLLPVIVTAKTKEEVKGELEQAKQSGVVVVTQEELQNLLQATIATPDAEAIYLRAWESIQPKAEF